MRIFALLSWYDEQPEHLTRCVESLKGFADVLVTLDGAYATFPGAQPESSATQHWALRVAVRRAGLKSRLFALGACVTEVEKRARLFDYARDAGATPEDWFLVIDADMALAEFTSDARDRLEATDLNVAEVRWHDVQVNDIPSSTTAFRSLFRALPGLTVERTHWLYVVPDPPCAVGCRDPNFNECCDKPLKRFLWHTPDGHISPEPALDLTGSVTLHHYNSRRDPERNQRAQRYYVDRDAAGLERVGDYK